MNARRTSQILVLLVGLFGVLMFVVPFIEAEEETEFPKLSAP